MMRPSHALVPLFLSALFVLHAQLPATGQEEPPPPECQSKAFGDECATGRACELGVCNMNQECVPILCRTGIMCSVGNDCNGPQYCEEPDGETCPCGAVESKAPILCDDINVTDKELDHALDAAQVEMEKKALLNMDARVTASFLLHITNRITGCVDNLKVLQ